MRGIKVLKRTSKKGIYCSGYMGGSSYTEFRVGKTYCLDVEPILCRQGYHFFKYDNFCFGVDYYAKGEDSTVYVEIESIGTTVFDTFKCAGNEIKIIRVIKKSEWSKWINDNYNSGNKNSGLKNSGSYNSGHYNSGDDNSGSYNSGHYNSGDDNSGNKNSGNKNSGNKNSGLKNSGSYNSGLNNSGNYNSGLNNSGDRNSGSYNSGHYNSGDWNSCDRETGFFNTEQPESINVFNKPCDVDVWYDCRQPCFIYFDLLVDKTYKESFIESFKQAKQKTNWKEELEILESLPNFDWKVFEEISGISKEMAYDPFIR